MTHPRIIVTRDAINPTMLPTFLNEYATFTTICRQNGIVALVEQDLRIERKVGNADIDQFWGGLSYFLSDCTVAMSSHLQRLRRYAGLLAGLTGRVQVTSASSFSRYLSAATFATVRPFLAKLLTHPLSSAWQAEMVRAAKRDSRGDRWQVFDYDHQRITVGQRRLPTGPAYPKPVRLVAGSPEDGRERRVRHYDLGVIRQSGTGLWLGGLITRSCGVMSTDLVEVIPLVRRYCAQNGLATDRTLLRLDNAGGNQPCLWACHQAQLPVLVRTTWYELLVQPAVQTRLATGAWEPVVSSDCGPQREAKVGGAVWLGHGVPYLDPALIPAEARATAIPLQLMVSRYRGAKHRGPGLAIGEYVYELYGATIPAGCLSAGDTVAWYFNRAEGENGIHQLNRRLQSQHLYSENLAGQELVLGIGMLAWNLRVILGWEAAGSPQLTITPELRAVAPTPASPSPVPADDVAAGRTPSDAVVVPDGSPATGPVSPQAGNEPPPVGVDDSGPLAVPDGSPAAALASTTAGDESPPVDTGGSGPSAVLAGTPAVNEPPPVGANRRGPLMVATGPAAALAGTPAAGEPLPVGAAEPASPSPRRPRLSAVKAHISELSLGPNAQWFSFDLAVAMLICAAGHRLRAWRIRHQDRRWWVVFRAATGVCGACSRRAECTKSRSATGRREVWLALPDSLLTTLDAETAAAERVLNASQPPTSTPLVYLPSEATAEPAPGPYRATPAAFFSMTYYQALIDAVSPLQIQVIVTAPDSPPPNHISPEEYRRRLHHRRCQWPERHQRNALRPEVDVVVQFTGAGESFQRLQPQYLTGPTVS